MKLISISALLLACAIATPALAGQTPPGKHPMKGHASMAPKSKMKSLGHGVYVDSKGAYHSKDGKFMSKADANKALGHGVKSKGGPMRDSHGRFMKSSKSHMSSPKVKTHSMIKTKATPAKTKTKTKTGMMSKLKSKLTKKQ